MSSNVPAWDAADVTPSDSTDHSGNPFRSLYVGTAGDVAVETEGGTAITFHNVPGGAVLPVRVVKVMSTNTTASDIIGLR